MPMPLFAVLGWTIAGCVGVQHPVSSDQCPSSTRIGQAIDQHTGDRGPSWPSKLEFRVRREAASHEWFIDSYEGGDLLTSAGPFTGDCNEIETAAALYLANELLELSKQRRWPTPSVRPLAKAPGARLPTPQADPERVVTPGREQARMVAGSAFRRNDLAVTLPLTLGLVFDRMDTMVNVAYDLQAGLALQWARSFELALLANWRANMSATAPYALRLPRQYAGARLLVCMWRGRARVMGGICGGGALGYRNLQLVLAGAMLPKQSPIKPELRDIEQIEARVPVYSIPSLELAAGFEARIRVEVAPMLALTATVGFGMRRLVDTSKLANWTLAYVATEPTATIQLGGQLGKRRGGELR